MIHPLNFELPRFIRDNQSTEAELREVWKDENWWRIDAYLAAMWKSDLVVLDGEQWILALGRFWENERFFDIGPYRFDIDNEIVITF